MAQIAQLTAEPRTAHRKTGAKAVRNAGKVPAVIYGQGREPQHLSVGSVELVRLLERIVPASTIVEVTVDGRMVKTLIREVQRHPLRQGIVHVDFMEIQAGKKLRLEVPVQLVGIPDGVRNQGGILDQVLRTVEIEVLPADIPEKVELDVSALVIGKSVHVSELSIPNAVILTDRALTVATVSAPRVEEEVTPAAAAAVEGAEAVAVAEPEVIKKGKIDEEEGAEE
jgi:large subunit ribosomal protein L25